MKKKCDSMLYDLKHRAIKQLEYAIPILFAAGKDTWYNFYNPATDKGEAIKVVGCYCSVFRIDNYDDEQQVLFYSPSHHEFRPVLDMDDICSLVQCSDWLLMQANEIKSKQS